MAPPFPLPTPSPLAWTAGPSPASSSRPAAHPLPSSHKEAEHHLHGIVPISLPPSTWAPLPSSAAKVCSSNSSPVASSLPLGPPVRLPAVRHGAATQQPWAPPSPTSSKPSPSPAPSAINYSLDLRRGVPLARRLPGATPRGVTPPRRRCSSADLPGRQRSSSHRPPCSLEALPCAPETLLPVAVEHQHRRLLGVRRII
ncbi:hypothetical protein U9M48_024715 [Paspalum notatum var. saurae]|uniref:Uncharacterized protein n=1 Tax=Paspalum notatum var. saurae TaxID=547442 RepID=A0AAQ3WWW0_PASNO